MLVVGLAQLLPRFSPDATEKVVRKAVGEAQHVGHDSLTRGGDWRALRGIPAIGRGVQGAIFGTRPDREALRKLA